MVSTGKGKTTCAFFDPRDANRFVYASSHLDPRTHEAPKTKPPSERSEKEKDPTAKERGSKGGKKGGPARAESLTAEERSEAAKKAASVRWKGGGATGPNE